MLNSTLKLARAQHASLFSSHTLPHNITRKPSAIRFVQAAPGSNQARDMDPKLESDSNPKDTMTSFGEGYATRSDEEGFGGVYGGNQRLPKDNADDKAVHGPSTTQEFDHDQGCEVKEKEKARNQSRVGPN